jgi:putative transposase
MRTFCIGYDPDGIIVELGKSDISRIYRLCHAYDKLQSKWSQPTTKHSKRYRYRNAGARIQLWIRNLVDKFHKKKKKRACENYNTIFLPNRIFAPIGTGVLQIAPDPGKTGVFSVYYYT